jgi:iron complex outermembrane receptor protein
VDIAGFYNEILTGVSYENYDLLRTDMIRCKNVKDFNIYNPTYGNGKCTSVSASDSDQTISGELLRLRSGRAVPDGQMDRRRRALPVLHPVRRQRPPFNVNTDSSDEQWTPKFGLVYKLTPSISLFGNVAQSFMPQYSIASYIGDLPPNLHRGKWGRNSTSLTASPPIFRCLIFTNAT